MKLSVIITNHNYGRYLRECYDSACEFGDEVLVYDDGSTDESMDILTMLGATVYHREVASGDPVWGSNLGIEHATGTHLMFLDADNVMCGRPSARHDYTYAPIIIIDDAGVRIGQWDYDGFPLDADDAMRRFVTTRQIPVPWGGVWNLDWLRRNGLRWHRWPDSLWAADFRTCVDWVAHRPTIACLPYPILRFRQHAGQLSSIDASNGQAAANELASLIAAGEADGRA